MYNLCFGMKIISITQLPGGDLSHPNNAVDLAGSDVGIDFWFAQGSWKCIAGPWGNGTFFFVSCDNAGAPTRVHCADGIDRIVTIALTHSARQYVRTTVGKIYGNGLAMYEEGTVGNATGNHIHLEVAEGIRDSKTYDKKLGVYRMTGELNPIEVMFVNNEFSKVAFSHGADLKHVNGVIYIKPAPVYEKGTLLFVADRASCRIRKNLAFSNGKPIGTVLATMPKGSTAEITHLTNRHEKDAAGFEYFQVKYQTPTGDIVEGYVQGDLGSYLIKKA